MKQLKFFAEILFLVCFFPSTLLLSQEKFRIISYNVENLYDCERDTLINDNPFTGNGEYQWTYGKYLQKLNNISKAIVAAGEWEIPALIGLCEVENATVVSDLLQKTQLRNSNYKFLHQNSPDLRGVDVALIYLPGKFKVISEKYLRVVLEERPTRDILFASGIVPGGDTLHVFVNHWPSRYGGELESEPNRIIAAKMVKHITDSLFRANIKSNIIIMGDFNDYPSNVSLAQELGAVRKWETATPGKLYNLCAQFERKEGTGSHKFGGEWGILDQFIVSGELLNENAPFRTAKEEVRICRAPFLLKKDKTDGTPKRSFLGTFFVNGFSDHLPVCLDIFVYLRVK
jgi:hypothetical protein